MGSTGKEEIILKGVAASPGVAHGPAFLFVKKDLEIPRYFVPAEKREEQVARFEAALLQTRKQISAIRSEIEERLGDEEAQIFDAHQLVLEDRALIDETEREIYESGYNIEYCFQKVANRYIEAFSNIDDAYIKERVADIKDVARRLLHNLMGKTDTDLSQLTENRIIVSDDLTPSETAGLQSSKVAAIVTNQGSRTSHAVIVARSINVPAVVGLHTVTEVAQPDDVLIVDGYDGIVIINPTEQSLYRYGKIRLERQNVQQIFLSALKEPSETSDGRKVKVMLNVEGTENEDVLRNSGACGVGLYRTEGLFLRRDTIPTEEEQYQAYKRIVATCAPNDVIIRTLDLGGDKTPQGGQLVNFQEANPFMGFRAIRFCLENPHIFKEQLRAILRASAHGNVKLMYPMISSCGELRSANALLEVCKTELRSEGIAFDENLQVGSMIEIPSAAYSADLLAKDCDFFSIGTNDLIQYMLAVDRVNDRVAHLYEPNHPAILRTLRVIFEAGKRAGIPVGVCGEMAGDPVYAAILFGMGASEISVSPASLPEIKFLIRNVTSLDLETLAEQVLSVETPEHAALLMNNFYSEKVKSKIVRK